MKTRIILFLLCLITMNVMGQGTVLRKKCNTCGKVISQCQYKGKHPKPKQEAKPTQKPKQSPKQTQATTQQRTVTTSKPTTPAVKTCEICAKPISQCDYGGKHPYCPTCKKLEERCAYKGEHPVCQTCGQLKEKCEYKGEHPKQQPESTIVSTMPLTEKSFSVGDVIFTMVPVEVNSIYIGETTEQKSHNSAQKPTHGLTLSNYYIGKYEVTQALWKAVMGKNPSHFKNKEKPVEQVSWNDCQEFLKKLNSMTGKNFRLPTEAEWEFAARGGNLSKGYPYSGSDILNDVAWFWGNSGKRTHEVGTKSPNELGIYDMTGNVIEWCQDFYDDNNSEQTNWTGQKKGNTHMCRGGGWSFSIENCRVDNRSYYSSHFRLHYLGLRLALSE